MRNSASSSAHALENPAEHRISVSSNHGGQTSRWRNCYVFVFKIRNFLCAWSKIVFSFHRFCKAVHTVRGLAKGTQCLHAPPLHPAQCVWKHFHRLKLNSNVDFCKFSICFLAFSTNFVLISYIFVCTRSDALDSRGIGPSKSALTVGDEDIMLTIEVPFAQRLRWQLSTKSHFTRIDFVILTISKFICTYTLFNKRMMIQS